MLFKFRIIVLAFALIGVLACRKEPKKKSFDKTNYKEHYSDVIKGTLLLPPYYEEVTLENRPYLVSKEDSISVLKNVISFLDSDRVDYVIYAKEGHSDDVIIIRKSEHINFTKQDANQYLGIIEHDLRTNWNHLNYSRIEKKMTQTERSRYIKLKYHLEFEEKSVYHTQYVVTSTISTFQVIELRKDSIDYEDLIKRINYVVN